MNPCIRSTGPIDAAGGLDNLPESQLQFRLHGPQVGLILEPRETRTIVLDGGPEPPQTYFLRPKSLLPFATAGSAAVSIALFVSTMSPSTSSSTTIGAASPRLAPILVIRQ